jgi:hypothetical protein
MRRLDSIRAEGEDEDDVRQLIHRFIDSSIHRLVPAKKRPVELMMYKISTSPCCLIARLSSTPIDL